ncbi:polysaccharide deacetylase family protein [Agromyces aerolatus]|uniref:polysaccharide deacetylase family protein n=1 Tax=Agromyces sp. LY-1074 TaxID=3074080 RepID=UPI00285C93C6|nr:MULTISPECIES: polysaccharide deacetylase family protein [unclassified Agromyces]MDR5699207.1 polysaccharide deacetylase family protein [Agromyces sp. LY-1074]MDR5705503.1 polysaccharide deacetylase family protein [Agromyces sp. LY-1358]
MTVSRRSLLAVIAVGAVGALAACETSAPRAAPADTPGPIRTRPRPSAPAPPTPVAAGAHPAPAHPQPDPAAVAAHHAGARPTAWGTALHGVRPSLHVPFEADGRARVAWTFDACGGSGGDGVDHALLDGLRAAAIPATLFLNARWIDRHPGLTAELAADPLFALANHGTRHLPLSVDGAEAYGIRGTGSVEEAVGEVWGNHELLTEVTGASPRYFRSGTAHYDDVAVQLVHDLGELPIGFTVNGDGGATYDAATVHAELLRANPGDIVIAHMNQPQSGTAQGAVSAAAVLRDRGVALVHLDL